MTHSRWIDAMRPSRRLLRGILRMTSGFSAINRTRHAEERPRFETPPCGCSSGVASRSTRERYATRRLTPVLIMLLIALAVAGCGKKGNPQPPPGEPNTYPRTYPSE